jgi:hypothetical protein
MVAHWEVCPPASLRTDRSDSASSPHFHRACGIAALTSWIIREVRRKCKARDIEIDGERLLPLVQEDAGIL